MAWLHHNKHRDSQRSRVYTGEQATWKVLAAHGVRRYIPVQEARETAQLLCDSLGLPFCPVKLGRLKRGGGHCGYDGMTVATYREPADGHGVRGPLLVSLSTVLHELAHWYAYNTLPANTTAAHGPEFAGLHVRILRRWFGHDDAVVTCMLEGYRAAGVKFNGPLSLD